MNHVFYASNTKFCLVRYAFPLLNLFEKWNFMCYNYTELGPLLNRVRRICQNFVLNIKYYQACHSETEQFLHIGPGIS